MKIPFLTHSTGRHNKNTTSNLVSGFTLIEMMVATTIFAMVMLMGVGSLVVSSNSAKSSRRIRTAVDNVNFAMESMTRELRTGTIYTCANDNLALSINLANADCDGNNGTPSNGNIIAFMPQQVGAASFRVGYYKSERKVNGVGDGTYTLERCEYTSSTKCSDIVSNDVDVQLLKFIVKGSSSSDNIQPSVEITMKGVVDVGVSNTPFSLQSMASQRSKEK